MKISQFKSTDFLGFKRMESFPLVYYKDYVTFELIPKYQFEYEDFKKIRESQYRHLDSVNPEFTDIGVSLFDISFEKRQKAFSNLSNVDDKIEFFRYSVDDCLVLKCWMDLLGKAKDTEWVTDKFVIHTYADIMTYKKFEKTQAFREVFHFISDRISNASYDHILTCRLLLTPLTRTEGCCPYEFERYCKLKFELANCIFK